jgi:hypothetical protein
MAHDAIHDARALNVLLGLVHELRKLGDWDTAQCSSEGDDKSEGARSSQVGSRTLEKPLGEITYHTSVAQAFAPSPAYAREE